MAAITCVNSSNALTIGNTGHGKLCCVYQSRTETRAQDVGIPALIKDPALESTRHQLRLGNKPKECDRCWTEEKQGRISKRQRDNAARSWSNDDIKVLELNLGNACNLKCRTCSPWSSSQWQKEAWDTDEKLRQRFTNEEWTLLMRQISEAWLPSSKIWKDLDKMLFDVEYLDFYGGEPWFNKHHWKILDLCVATGSSKNQRLHYNTNGTIWNDEQIKIFDHFQHVDIAFSIDGIGKQFELLRSPASFDLVKFNAYAAKEFARSRKNIQVSIHHTVSILNCYYVPEFIEHFQTDFPVWINIVYDPDYWSLTFLPNKIRDILIKRLETVDRYKFPQIKDLITVLEDSEYNEYLWTRFLEKLSSQDAYRSESYLEFFPEFGSIIQNF